MLVNGGPGAAVLHMAFTTGVLTNYATNPSDPYYLIDTGCERDDTKEECWLNFANVLLVDYPAGVGFSWAERAGRDTENTDLSVATDGL